MITELSIFLPNEPGMLANLIKSLSENDINLRAISVVETADYGLILLLVDKPKECIEFLETNSYEFTSTEVIGIKFNNDPTVLFNVANILGDNKINIEYLYLTVVEKDPLVILRVDNTQKASKLLTKNDFSLIEGNGL